MELFGAKKHEENFNEQHAKCFVWYSEFDFTKRTLSLVALTIGHLTLQQCFLEENFGPANPSFQKLQFRTFVNFDKLLSFLNKVPQQEKNLSTLLVPS